MAFKTQAEIFKALLDGKKIEYKDGEIVGLMDGNTCTFFLDGTSVPARWSFSHPNEWSIYEKPKPKKKVTLYRHTMSNRISGNIYQTTWESVETAVDTKFIEVIKTESKEVEYDDV